MHGAATRATRTPSSAIPTGRPASTTSWSATARTSRDGSSGSCWEVSARAAGKGRSRPPSRPSKRAPTGRLRNNHPTDRVDRAPDRRAPPGEGVSMDIAALADLLHETSEHHGAFEASRRPTTGGTGTPPTETPPHGGTPGGGAGAPPRRYMAEVKHITIDPT